ncbi:TylF/MycF/NovP-related O-methyltransferase [Rugosimonospora africana]|nr:TylF/MycF/NovP-related O-methyltransferase [Rugosimonospora africana]
MILELAAENRMGGVDNLVNIYWGLSSVLAAGVDGGVVEIGCYQGRTSVLLRMIIDHFAPGRELHVFDSFAGLPAPGPNDTDYTVEGQLATGLDAVRETFARWQVAEPIIHAGWFEETLAVGLPERLCFAYIDGDLYDSVWTSLEAVYGRLSPGAVVIVDDYCDPEKSPRAFPHFPGAKKACTEFFADKPEKMSVLVGSGNLAAGYFRKN